MRRVAVLCALEDSVYHDLDGVEVFTKLRDARKFTGGMPVVAHPPCAQWSRLRHFAKPSDEDQALAWFCLERVRQNGGVLEHPYPSVFFEVARLIGECSPGWSMVVQQRWFGHAAEKPTWLYVVGVSPKAVPVVSFSLDLPDCRNVSMLSRRERSATPREFAEWLVELARRSSVDV